MEKLEAKLDGVLLIKPTVFEDFRGFFVEIYNKQEYRKKEIKLEFLQDDISVSYKHILRGIHGDNKTWKLVSCLYGRIYSVVVNCNKRSPHFGEWESFNLTETNRQQILVPPKFGLSYLVLSEKAIFHYKQSTYYDPKKIKQFTYRYDDPNFKIWWPIKNPILSIRDERV